MRGACCASQEVTLAIELFLNENYRFRRNTLNGKVEFAELPKASVSADGNTAGDPSSLSSDSDESNLMFRPLTKAALNSTFEIMEMDERRIVKVKVIFKPTPSDSPRGDK